MLRRLLLALVPVLGVAACGGDLVPPRPSIEFAIEAPTCSQSFGFQFQIDHVIVGTDTLANGAASERFLTSTGQHEIEARVISPVVVRDTVAVLTGGQVFRFPVKLSC